MRTSFILWIWLAAGVPALADLTVTITKGPDNQVHIETDQGPSTTTNISQPPASPSQGLAPGLAPPPDPVSSDSSTTQKKALDEQKSQNDLLKQQLATLQRRLDQYSQLLSKPLEIVVKGSVVSMQWSGVSKDIPLPLDGKITLQLAPK